MKIAYLCNKEHYLKKMSRVRFHSMEAIEKISTFLWTGPNWENWDNNKTADENLKANNFTPDIIVGYKPLEIKGFAGSKFIKCIRYNEMHDKKWTTKEINASSADIVACHHKNDWEEWKERSFNKKINFINIPHCAEKTVFKDYGLEKIHDVLLVGALNINFYPLRQKMVEVLMEMKEDYKVGVFRHPGYNLIDASTNKYAIEFAKAINSTKICLTCSGSGKWRFGKYAEIPACRSAIAADIPDDGQVHFNQFAIKINPEDPVKIITNKLKEYLGDEEKLKKTTDKGWLLSRKYTQELYAAIFIEKITKILNEQ